MGSNSKNYSKGGIISSILLFIFAFLGLPPQHAIYYTHHLFTTVVPLLCGAIFLIVWSLNKNILWTAHRGISVTIGGICITGTIAHVLVGATNIVLMIVWSIVGILLTYLGFAKRKERIVTDRNNK